MLVLFCSVLFGVVLVLVLVSITFRFHKTFIIIFSHSNHTRLFRTRKTFQCAHYAIETHATNMSWITFYIHGIYFEWIQTFSVNFRSTLLRACELWAEPVAILFYKKIIMFVSTRNDFCLSVCWPIIIISTMQFCLCAERQLSRKPTTTKKHTL